MSFVKIATETRTTIDELFTLGVSTSRATENIGQFGSGTLMSTILWLRLFKESPIYYVNGEKVTFKTETAQKTDGDFYDRIVMICGRKKSPMSVSLEYGEKDWTDAGMALREWISNAIDQGSDLSAVCVVDKIEPGNGVEVYVRQTPETRAYLQSLSNHFLHGKAENQSKTVAKDVGPMRAYRRGVFIRSFKKPSLFDYNLDFDISENRNGSSDSMLHKISTLVSGYDYHNLEYYTAVWAAVLQNADVWEVTDHSQYDSMYGDWRAVLENETRQVYPISAALLQIEGLKGTPIQDAWYYHAIAINPAIDGMKECGTSAKKGFIGEKVTEGPIFDMMVRLHNVLWASGLDNGKTTLPNLEVFRTSDGSEPETRGYYDPETDTVGVYKGNKTDQSVMLEELAHRCSGHGDRTRNFQNYLVSLASAVIGETEL